MHTLLDALPWDNAANLCVLNHNHSIVCNVRAMEAYMVTQIRYARSFMCSMNEMCFLVFAWLELVRHVAELAK